MAKIFDEWEARLEELKQFKEEQDHCNIPRKYTGGLEIWMMGLQRRCMDDTWVKELEELGFG